MALANCKKCNKLFNKVLVDICEECIKEEEKALSTVQHFLRDNPRSTALQIAEKTGVTAARILQFARERKINLASTEGGKTIFKCQFCGCEINSGKVCSSCMGKLGDKTGMAPPPADTSETKSDSKRSRGGGSNILQKFQRK
jgi:hypothetical protein